jgi:hypothetical protein
MFGTFAKICQHIPIWVVVRQLQALYMKTSCMGKLRGESLAGRGTGESPDVIVWADRHHTLRPREGQ